MWSLKIRGGALETWVEGGAPDPYLQSPHLQRLGSHPIWAPNSIDSNFFQTPEISAGFLNPSPAPAPLGTVHLSSDRSLQRLGMSHTLATMFSSDQGVQGTSPSLT